MMRSPMFSASSPSNPVATTGGLGGGCRRVIVSLVGWVGPIVSASIRSVLIAHLRRQRIVHDCHEFSALANDPSESLARSLRTQTSAGRRSFSSFYVSSSFLSFGFSMNRTPLLTINANPCVVIDLGVLRKGATPSG